MPVTYAALLHLARDLSERRLAAVTRRRFAVGTDRDGLALTPGSTGSGQSDGRNASCVVGMLLADGEGSR